MKKVLLFASVLLLAACSNESVKRVMDGMGGILSEEKGLTSNEVAAGLREALQVGVQNAVAQGSQRDGFFKNQQLRIPFPEEAEKVRSTAMNLGLRSQVERFEETLNRAAEEATKQAAPIFIDAITSMSINDAFGILKGENTAATAYLRGRTEAELTQLFAPSVKDAIESVELTRYWQPLASAYNTASTFTGGQQVNPDLQGYVTERTMDGLFTLIAQEETKIRENPAARVSDLLRKVFGAQD